MTKRKILWVEPPVYDLMTEMCQKEYICSDSEGTEFDEEVVFDDGHRMAIQVCRSRNEPCWAQGILFDAAGQELGADPGVTFGSVYTVRGYTAEVRRKANQNCLEGRECPECGSLGPFKAETRCSMHWSDDGTGEYDSPQIIDGGQMLCLNCKHQDNEKEFVHAQED